MCKNSENGAKLLILTKYVVEKRHGGHRTGGTGSVRSALVTWPNAVSGRPCRQYAGEFYEFN